MAAKSAQACASEFTSCLIRRDINAALLLLTDDVVFFYSNGSVIIGKDAFAAAMTANWKIITDYEYSTVESIWIAESDTVASVIYSFAWSGLARGEKVSGSGTRVLSNDGSGWRIAHEHLSSGQWKPQAN
jgi:ketosteroid isomerase-like protein